MGNGEGATVSDAQPQDKQHFKSNLDSWTHVMVLDHEGHTTTERVEPLGVVWLTKTEQQLTANMHAKPEDNPFLPREHVHYDHRTLDEIKRFTAPTFELVDGGEFHARPIGADQAPQGQYDSREMTGAV